MLSPDGSEGCAKAAPSIWSFDSGYGSGAVEEEGQRNNAFYLQGSTSSNSLVGRLGSTENDGLELGFTNLQFDDQVIPKREEPAIEPITEKLSVFTTKDTDNDFYLPIFSSESEGCLTCEFWRITNPGENVRCEDCRIPEIIEPSLLYNNESKGKHPILSVETPVRRKKTRPRKSSRARCSACELSVLIDPSGPSSCSSCASFQDSGLLSPISPSASDYTIRRSRAGRNSKLPLSALNRLQGWLDAHQENPYPTAEVKRQLAQECSITEKQVTTWFTNARARQLNPLETYLSSASEDEGADKESIASAAETPAYQTGFAYISSERPSAPYRRAGSISGSSAFSGSHNNRPQPSRRGKKKNYRRSNQPPQITEQSSFTVSGTTLNETGSGDQETWQCTFCRRHLVPKSWRRHEETQHRPRAQWTCMLFGPRLSMPHRAGSCCAFCMEKDPTEEHFTKFHRISECAKRKTEERTFYRPDHLRQHVKNFHGATLFDVAQGRWKKGADAPSSDKDGWTCGFCGEHLETWDRRETHIANHFKEGMTMASWRDFPSKEDKKKSKKEKEKKEERPHSSGLGLERLTRSFTRRSTRNSQKSSSNPNSQEQPPVTFANVFDSIPTSIPYSMDGFSAAPVLPDINTDSLMGAYGNFPIDNHIDWNAMTNAMTQPQYTENLVYDPALDTNFGDSFGNVIDYHINPDDYQQWNPQN